ncbi:hypothetical protein ZHAS_00010703 [Anopheles sinensis]|uniref:Uncharacterized protein n=1 Tax=Anopheles sinensis TaxID=74873 RepID=A0A084VYI5_ANOSI|nr:hypothetical protein ZHAS_00010703 [Anopheles sinensis]
MHTLSRTGPSLSTLQFSERHKSTRECWQKHAHWRTAFCREVRNIRTPPNRTSDWRRVLHGARGKRFGVDFSQQDTNRRDERERPTSVNEPNTHRVRKGERESVCERARRWRQACRRRPRANRASRLWMRNGQKGPTGSEERGLGLGFGGHHREAEKIHPGERGVRRDGVKGQWGVGFDTAAVGNPCD